MTDCDSCKNDMTVDSSVIDGMCHDAFDTVELYTHVHHPILQTVHEAFTCRQGHLLYALLRALCIVFPDCSVH